MNRTHRPIFLSFTQFSLTGVLGLGLALIFETLSWSTLQPTLPAILYAGIVSGSLAYTLQIIAQKHTPAAEAALVLSLESVFAAITGAILLGERLSLTAMAGCGFILLGVIIVELG